MEFILPILVMNGVLIVLAIILIIANQVLVNYGECKIIINKDRALTVTGGNSLLSYFVENKMFIPSACGGKATCGYCKVRVLSGAGQMLPTEEVFITREERSSGLRLACQVKVKNNVEVYIPEYLLDTKEYKTKVTLIEPLTHDIKHIVMTILPPDKIKFKPGQYIQFKIPGSDEFRAYSIASAPRDDDRVELIVRLVPSGFCSTYIHEVLKVGDEISLTGPFGEFFLQEQSDNEIVCIGGGCGMAPIRAILYRLMETNIPRKTLFFFGARSKRDLFYTDELRKIEKQYPKFKYIPALSEPKADDKWDGEVGLITHVVEKYVEDGTKVESYLCGPPPMIDASIAVLMKKGVRKENIFYDKF